MGGRQIVCTPGCCGGSPRIDGTRITVANIVAPLDPRTVKLEQVGADFEGIQVLDAVSALRYCAAQQCLLDRPESFCQQCTLNKEPIDPPAYFLGDPGDATRWRDEKGAAGDAELRSRVEWLRDQPERRDLWNIAREVLRSLALTS